MKPEGKAVLLLAVLTVSCHKPSEAPVSWAFEQRAATNGVEAVIRMNPIVATPGQRLVCELEADAPAGCYIAAPGVCPPGLELVDEITYAIQLAPGGRERHQFRWVFQAGPPATLSNVAVRVPWKSSSESGVLGLGFPGIVIRSAFPPGQATNILPPLEE